MEVNKFVINNVEITTEDFNHYIDIMINKIFKVLGIYENCEETKNYESFDSYTFRLIEELSGFHKLVDVPTFLSLSSILTDLRSKVLKSANLEESEKLIHHKNVKSLVFHCISLIKKEKGN